MMSVKVFLTMLAVLVVGVKNSTNRNEYKQQTYESPAKLKAAQEAAKRHQAYLKQQNHWVDSVLATLSDDEKFGQLFMVAAYSNRGADHAEALEKQIEKHHLGGLIFFQGGPVRQALLANRLQAKSRIPLLIGMDCEWGLGMRLDSTLSFPRAMTLGAIQNREIIYEMGREVARQFRRLGMHVNFAPVVDVNVDPANPVIGTRSFGELPNQVALSALAYMKGMQHHGIMASAKHFPGHGDTNTDSHYALPVVKKSRGQLDTTELVPFQRLIADSLMSVLVAHLHVPALDSTQGKPTTLSRRVVTDLLQGQLGFRGLTFTDALNMAGARGNLPPGETELQAFLAGNDCLLFPSDVGRGLALIKQAVADGRVPMAEVEKRVRKILATKYFVGLNKYQPVETKNLVKDLNPPLAKALRAKLYAQAVTVAKNEGGFLPITTLDTLSFASVVIGAGRQNDFQRILGKYAPFAHHVVAEAQPSAASLEAVRQRVRGKKVVVVGLLAVSTTNRGGRNYGVTEPIQKFIEQLEAEPGTRVVVASFGQPYSLRFLAGSRYLLCANDDNADTQAAVPQILFGAMETSARLPVSAGAGLPAGTGVDTRTLQRLKYTYLPETAGMDSQVLARIDTIARRAIQIRAAPGCHVLVAKDGNVVFSKTYGHYTYDAKDTVLESSLYDVASVTKVAATMQAVMWLHDQGKLDINKKFSDYLPDLKGSNKEDVVIKDALLHQAGLIQSQPFWWRTMTKGQPKPEFFSRQPSEEYNVEVADHLYATASIKNQVWDWMKQNPLRKNKRPDGKYGYLYSDLGFYMLKEIVERTTGQSIEEFMDQQFYRPLGLGTMTYRPLLKFEKDRIVPSEEDRHFRKTRVQGVVNDSDAALQGGVGGHAGLFCNADDLAILMQMNLQHGQYGQRKYFQDTATVPFFTAKRLVEYNRRGLGWDKPTRTWGGPTSGYCSDRTFGHTGYTGACAWVDPDQNLIYVFLTNRTYPSATNWRLKETNIRNLIHNTIYESLGFTTRRFSREKGVALED
jgi:beta-N-acetylhexosaminidase